jgi:hypothetical protein
MKLRAGILVAPAVGLLAACSASGPTPSDTLDGTAAHHAIARSPAEGTLVAVTISVTAADGRPAPGARVVLAARYAVSSGWCGLVGAEKLAEGETDGSGLCLLPVLVSGSVAGLRAAACGGQAVGASDWVDHPLAGSRTLGIRLGDGVRPRGVVLDIAGRFVPGAAVEAWYGVGNLRVFRSVTVADGNGTFVLPPLPRAAADDLHVEASEPGVGSGGVTPVAGDPLDAIRITLDHPAIGHGGARK